MQIRAYQEQDQNEAFSLWNYCSMIVCWNDAEKDVAGGCRFRWSCFWWVSLKGSRKGQKVNKDLEMAICAGYVRVSDA
jgi:hypothetical protein